MLEDGLLEDGLLEDGLSLAEFSTGFFVLLLLARLTLFSSLEKAASSILLLILEGLLDPGEGLVELSEFSLVDDV